MLITAGTVTVDLEELKILISILGIVVPSSISVFTIMTNIGLTLKNYSSIKKQNKKKIEIDSVYSYYLPVKFLLLKIYFAYMSIQTKDFCIWNTYRTQVNARNDRNKILEAYKFFSENYSQIEKKLNNFNIDQQIEKVYEHILFVEIEENLSEAMQKEKYLLPDVQCLITDIDNYVQQCLSIGKNK